MACVQSKKKVKDQDRERQKCTHSQMQKPKRCIYIYSQQYVVVSGSAQRKASGQSSVVRMKGVYRKRCPISCMLPSPSFQSRIVKLVESVPELSVKTLRFFFYSATLSRARPSSWAFLNSRMTNSYVNMVTVAAGTARIMLVPSPA